MAPYSPLNYHSLSQEHEKYPSDIVVEKIEQRPIHSDEVYNAQEAFLISSSRLVAGVTSWNGQKIGDGLPGPSALAFENILENDKKPREDAPPGLHIEVPYGFTTGMRSQIK